MITINTYDIALFILAAFLVGMWLGLIIGAWRVDGDTEDMR